MNDLRYEGEKSPLDGEVIEAWKTRICMLTSRNVDRDAWRCGHYAAEDVLCNVDDVDMIELEPKRGYRWREAFQRDLIWHDITGRSIFHNMAYKPVIPSKEYDVFIAYLPHYRDLIHIPSVRGWKERCRTSICWIDELWAVNLRDLKRWLRALNRFEHIAVGLEGTAKALSNMMGRACHHVQNAVDAILFCPYPQQPHRVIDIYSIGRTHEGVHRALKEVTCKRNWFYIYDTFRGSDRPVRNYRQHREMFANIAKRSRFFIVQPAKADIPGETGGQIEIGGRYFEGSAAGAVLLGQRPECESYDSMFSWPDAVIEIKVDGSDVARVLSELYEQPERMLEISCRNMREALLHHDWVYRWEKILNIVGIEPSAKMVIRKTKLRDIAEGVGMARM